jgi:hypothetical protein
MLANNELFLNISALERTFKIETRNHDIFTERRSAEEIRIFMISKSRLRQLAIANCWLKTPTQVGVKLR